MRISDTVAAYLLHMLDVSNGNVEIRRNELAEELGCVPSQINYVITSRFTPEQGYIVESRRGGGGYIRITRIKMDKDVAIMHIINSVGERLDGVTASVMLNNMLQRGIISTECARLMAASMSNQSYCSVPPQYRDALRAALFKNLLITVL